MKTLNDMNKQVAEITVNKFGAKVGRVLGGSHKVATRGATLPKIKKPIHTVNTVLPIKNIIETLLIVSKCFFEKATYALEVLQSNTAPLAPRKQAHFLPFSKRVENLVSKNIVLEIFYHAVSLLIFQRAFYGLLNFYDALEGTPSNCENYTKVASLDFLSKLVLLFKNRERAQLCLLILQFCLCVLEMFWISKIVGKFWVGSFILLVALVSLPVVFISFAITSALAELLGDLIGDLIDWCRDSIVWPPKSSYLPQK